MISAALEIQHAAVFVASLNTHTHTTQSLKWACRHEGQNSLGMDFDVCGIGTKFL